MVLEGTLISSGKAWKKITEGKAVSKLLQEKKEKRPWLTLPRDAVLRLWGKTISADWVHVGKEKEGLKSQSCKIGSFLPLLGNEVSFL